MDNVRGFDGMQTPVRIKLLTLWALDNEYWCENPETTGFISHGLWETYAVQIIEESGVRKRVYTLKCVLPTHPLRKFGETVRMYEDVILGLCHPARIEHLPKLIDK